MKKLLLPTIVLLLVCGCRTYSYTRTEVDGTITRARILVFMSNTQLAYLKMGITTNGTAEATLRKAGAEIDKESVKAITQGVTEAVLKALKTP